LRSRCRSWAMLARLVEALRAVLPRDAAVRMAAE
jgi:hypothetical protein